MIRFNSLSNQKQFLIAFVLICISLGTRILFLSAPSLWLDEAVSANIAKLPLPDYFQWARGDFHPPLYYLLLHFWSLLGNDEFTLRLFSVITNCLSGIILFFCIRNIMGRSTAFLTLLLFAISPFQIRYSQEVRMYSLLGFWIVSVLFFACRYLKNGSWPALLGTILASALALYTHYHAGVFLIILNLAVSIQLYHTEKGRLRRWFVAQLMILGLFTPWLPNFIHQFRAGGLSWFPFRPSFPLLCSPLFSFLWGEPFSSKLYRILSPHLSKLEAQGSLISLHGKLGWALLMMLLILMVWMGRKKIARLSWPIFFSVFLVVGTLGLSYGISFKSNIYGAKYLFGTSFIYYGVVAALLTALIRFSRKIGIGLGITVLILQVFMLINYYQPRNHRENWRGAVAYIRDHSKPHQAVGFHFDQPMGPYIYYSHGSIPAFGFLKGRDLSPSLSMVTKEQWDAIWLFDYLAELYDPDGKVKQTLVEQGYIPFWHHNFNGVPLTMWRKVIPSEEEQQ